MQEEVLALLRNLACNNEDDIGMTISGFGEAQLFSMIEEKLQSSRDAVVLHVRHHSLNADCD